MRSALSIYKKLSIIANYLYAHTHGKTSKGLSISLICKFIPIESYFFIGQSMNIFKCKYYLLIKLHFFFLLNLNFIWYRIYCYWATRRLELPVYSWFKHTRKIQRKGPLLPDGQSKTGSTKKVSRDDTFNWRVVYARTTVDDMLHGLLSSTALSIDSVNHQF